MLRNPMHPLHQLHPLPPLPPNAAIVAKAVPAFLLILLILLMLLMLLLMPGCSREAAPSPPAVTAADRALPVAVDIPEQPTPLPVKAVPSVQRKVPIEDTLEPIPIDDAPVPSSAKSTAGSRVRK